MKGLLLKYGFYLACAFLLICCKQEFAPGCHKLILDAYPFNGVDKTQGKLFSDSRICPIEGVLLSKYVFEQADSERILVRDKKTIVIIDTNGIVLTSFSKLGKGPGEYILPLSVSVDKHRNRILVFDYHRNDRLLAYALDGKPIGSVDISIPAALALYNNADDCVYIISSNREEGISIVNLANGMIRSEVHGGVERTLGMITIPGIMHAGSDVILIKPGCDTLYNMSRPGAPPFLILDKGCHSSASKKCLATNEGIIMDGYVLYRESLLFLSFVYNRCRFYDIWDISHEELLYRQKIGGPDEPMGYPVAINGKQIYVWPSIFSEDGFMYCELYDVVDGMDCNKSWFVRSKIVF